MKQSTHIAFGNALALAILQPMDLKSLTVITSATTIGSIISDVDVTTSESHKDLEKIIIISFISIVVASILEVYNNIGIFSWLQANRTIAKLLACILIFFCITFWGMHQPHRTFMHSIPATLILTGIICIINYKIAIYFAIGMCSHIFLDLFNKKKIQILYPAKLKICLNLCESNGKIDKAIGKISYLFWILEIIFLLVKNII